MNVESERRVSAMMNRPVQQMMEFEVESWLLHHDDSEANLVFYLRLCSETFNEIMFSF